jgi:imidazoleglycerol-phosphate dehydratase
VNLYLLFYLLEVISMSREAKISRKTLETDINIQMNIDGTGKSDINTGIGFLNHMLILLAKHGHFDLMVKAKGDLDVDNHHTVEDIGIVLGQTLKQALGDKKSIKRYGASFIPMDEALAMVVLDLSGRPYVVFEASFLTSKVGNMETEIVEDFFRAVAVNVGMNLHIKILYGVNSHHIIEAMFKAFAKALDEATTLDQRIDGLMTTKGTLD